MNPQYIVSEDGRTTVCLITSKGEQFKGIARCYPSDTLNPYYGRMLARYRAELAVRTRDLIEVQFIKTCLKDSLESLPQSRSKLWDRYYQDACYVEKEYLRRIKNLKQVIYNMAK